MKKAASLQYFLRIRLRGEASCTSEAASEGLEDGGEEDALLFMDSMSNSSAGSPPSLSVHLFCKTRKTCFQSDPRILFFDVIQPPDLQSMPVEEYAIVLQTSLKQISTACLIDDDFGSGQSTKECKGGGNGKEIFELMGEEEECEFRIWTYVEELETHSLLAQIPMHVSSQGKVPFDVLWNPLVSLSRYFSFVMQNMDKMEEFKEGFEVVQGELRTLLDTQDDERSLLYQKFAVVLNHKKSRIRDLESQVVNLQGELSALKKRSRRENDEEDLDLDVSLDSRLQQRARRGRKVSST
eukprot:TRINITY_DN16201_c0_g1_i5.p1 TRINITY_DN16201_c0_g1~~TRINITY_DN16201_c0_g1_i5.p1  ORF type:complete len:296 (-),score=92.52 TRINITY_DN16201_c0_g1_i5:226-1113(-)